MLNCKLFFTSLLFCHILNRHFDSFCSTKYSLIIGILSAQEHFERRNVLRNTWLKPLADSKRVAYYFLIGKYFCSVPLEDRLFIEDCHDWSLVFHNWTGSWEDTFQIGVTEKYLANNDGTISQQVTEFIFVVAFDIKVTSVGVVSSVVKNNGNFVSVKMYNENNSILVSTNFTISSVSGNDVTWIEVSHLFLPKGFEGRIRIEADDSFLVLDSAKCPQKDTGQSPSVVHILHPISKSSCFLLGFKYVLNDVRDFKEFVRNRMVRFKDRQNQISTLKGNLDQEVAEFKDVLPLNLVDVYRNLPLKVLTFFHWIAENKEFEYAMKTDDDTLVNIETVVAEVEDSLQRRKNWQWWSCFRSKWPVMDIGKWREYNFISRTYPEFPAGSGYVLHYTMVEYLSKNFNNLFKHFQGEDVSVGIWLNAILPVKHIGQFCHWACDNLYQAFSCNVANLDVAKFSHHWVHYWRK